MKIKKLYKCSVKYCNRIVRTRGAFCDSCFNKITDSNNIVLICIACEKIIDIIISI